MQRTRAATLLQDGGVVFVTLLQGETGGARFAGG